MPIESYSEIAEQQQTARNRLGNMAKAEFEKEVQNQVKVAEHFGANCLTETETLCFHSASRLPRCLLSVANADAPC